MPFVYVAKGRKAPIISEDNYQSGGFLGAYTGKFETRKIYATNFHNSANPRDLKVFFGKFGPVQEVCIRKHKQKNEKLGFVSFKTFVRSARFAFVIFEEIGDAQKAISAQPHELELNGYTLEVQPALSQTKLKVIPNSKKSEPKKKVNAETQKQAVVDGCAPVKKNLGIGDLNSSCLLQIFSYFTQREKRQLELVCKRWRNVLLEQRKRMTYVCCKELGSPKTRSVNAESSKSTSVDVSGLEKVSSATRKRSIGINHLNDDCFFIIFSYFSLRERIGLELVCKRWRQILLDQWKMLTSLNFEKDLKFGKLRYEMLQGILKKYGPSILKVETPQFHQLRRSTVHMIAFSCIHLRHLCIQNLPLSSKDLKALISNCKNLKSLELKRPLCKKSHNFDFIQQVLEKVPLESFVFMHKQDNCKFLTSLPSTLKNLELISCKNLNVDHLLSGLSKATNLQSFRISNVKETLLLPKELYSSISNVEEFSANQIRISNVRTLSLQIKSNLLNLRFLSLKCSSIEMDDSDLANISEGCKKLEALDISGCVSHSYTRKVSDMGIKALVKHCVLTDLSIRGCPGITDHGLSILANAGKLKKLSCAHCVNITDVGCCQLISLCLELELLNIEGCRRISSIVVASAVSTISVRSEKKTLHLFVNGTRILPSEIPRTDRSLAIHREIYLKNCVIPEPKVRPIRRYYCRRRYSDYDSDSDDYDSDSDDYDSEY